MIRKEKDRHIDVISIENPLRMGFYVPGKGIVIKTNKGKKNEAVVKHYYPDNEKK